MQQELYNFYLYVFSFYGNDEDSIFGYQFENGGFTFQEIINACNQYRAEAGESWGGGDSIDRERVRTILEPNYSPLI